MHTSVPQDRVKAILLTQPLGLLQVMQRMGQVLRAEVVHCFPHLTLAEHVAVCEAVVRLMQEAVEEARVETGRMCADEC